jgi:hypothetical protein
MAVLIPTTVGGAPKNPLGLEARAATSVVAGEQPVELPLGLPAAGVRQAL